jgi:glycosyltransferase involved in cell wall biosynthesis
MATSEWPTPEHPHQVPFVVRQVDFLRRAGVAVDVFPFRGNKKVINYAQAWWRFRGQLDPQRYDLVHAQFGQSALLAWPKRLPLVVTFRGCDILGDKGADGRTTRAGKLLQRLCRMVARRADAVIAVSEHMRPYVPPSVPLHIIPSGLDFDSLPCIPAQEARRRLGLPPADRLVLFVGNPADVDKRYPLAVRAVEILNQTLPAQLVRAWQKPHTDIPVFMSACDALVFTSQQEGSPNVVKEALACNLPVVSVPVGDVPLRLQGVAGCEMCVDDRPETIAAALQRVLRKGQRIQGRETVHELDERLLTEKVISVYRSVLARKVRQGSASTAASERSPGSGGSKPARGDNSNRQQRS